MWNGANDPVEYPNPTDGDGPLDSDTCLMCGRYPSWPVKHGDGWLCGECAADHEHVPPPRKRPKPYNPWRKYPPAGESEPVRLGTYPLLDY